MAVRIPGRRVTISTNCLRYWPGKLHGSEEDVSWGVGNHERSKK